MNTNDNIAGIINTIVGQTITQLRFPIDRNYPKSHLNNALNIEFGSLRRNGKYLVGEYGLGLFHSYWELSKDKIPIINNLDERSIVASHISILQNQKLISLNIDPNSLDAKVVFSENLELAIKYNDAEFIANWSWLIEFPDEMVLYFGPNKKYWYESKYDIPEWVKNWEEE
jgi:hypothetical protein